MNKLSIALILVISRITMAYSMESNSDLVEALKEVQPPIIIVSSEINKSSQSSVEIEWNSPYVSPDSSGDVKPETIRVSIKKSIQESISTNNEVHLSYSQEALCWYACFLCCLPQHLGYAEIN